MTQGRAGYHLEREPSVKNHEGCLSPPPFSVQHPLAGANAQAGELILPRRRRIPTLTAGILSSVSEASRQTVDMTNMLSLIGTDWIHNKFTELRIPDKVCQSKHKDHEKKYDMRLEPS